MSTERANPFADLGGLPTFEPKPKASSPVARERIEQIADANNFPSRQAQPRNPSSALPKPRRRYKTGRNQQLNVKATAQVIERFYKLADQRRVPLGELLDQALTALEKSAAPDART